MALQSGLGGQLSIDLGALARNWRALDKVSAGALTGAVVKADAYGIGITMACKALHAAGARFFFVATPDEGLAVRAALPDVHIFVLNGLYPGAANLYVRQNLMPILSSGAMLEEWLAKCLERNEAYPAAKLSIDEVALGSAGLVPFGENDPNAQNLKFAHRSRIVDHVKERGLEGLLTLVGVRYNQESGAQE